MMSTYCPSCGHELAAAAQFCAQCGTPRPAGGPEATSVLSASPLPPPSAGPSAHHYGPRPGAGFDLRGWLFGSLQPATILVFAAAAGAFSLPAFIYAYSDYPARSNGAQAVLAILQALALIAAVAGTWAASHLLREGREDTTAARVVFGFGIFACVLNGLGFLTTLGR